LAISDDQAEARLGLGELQALADSYLNDPEVQTFVDAALEAVVQPVADEIDDHPDAQIEPASAVPDDGIVTGAGRAGGPQRPIQ
jgi:hypothetical protein